MTTLILKGDDFKEITVPPKILHRFKTLFAQNKGRFTIPIEPKQVTAEMIHMALVFYQVYNIGGIDVIEKAIESKSNKSDFYQMWHLLETNPSKMIQLLWVADYLGTTELRDFLYQTLVKSMSVMEIKKKLKDITLHGITLSCDACRKHKAEYVNMTHDRFFCSYTCFEIDEQ